MFIVFEGIDASGKQTQQKLLAKALRKDGHDVLMIDFPDYSTPTGKAIRKFLQGKYKVDLETIALLYAADRRQHHKKIKEALDNGKIVIADRYVYSNIAYQGSQGVKIGWLACLDATLVFPNLVVYLDIPPEVSLKRKKKGDNYEKNAKLLEGVRETYIQMATGDIKPFRQYNDYAEWVVIEGTRSIEEVHKDILDAVKQRIPRSITTKTQHR